MAIRVAHPLWEVSASKRIGLFFAQPRAFGLPGGAVDIVMVDELNAFVGVLLSHDLEVPDQQFLLWLQHKLFSVGGYLATDTTQDAIHEVTAVTERAVAKIEREIDRLDGMVPPLKAFILPSGGAITAAAHVCRTVCRRAERIIYRLNSEVALEPNVLRFMNRLSDYFFALARKEVLRIHGQEIVWTYDHNDD